LLKGGGETVLVGADFISLLPFFSDCRFDLRFVSRTCYIDDSVVVLKDLIQGVDDSTVGSSSLKVRSTVVIELSLGV
jgi:hypothetical protein